MTRTDIAEAQKPHVSPEEYHARLRELESSFPVPTWEEVREDWKWLHDRMANGTFDPEYRYAGLAVAIHNRQVVGTDVNWLQLLVATSQKLGVHPERIVITSFPAV